ncbi:MAG: Uma2 family endonuclease [Bacteroidota bacterium]
MRDWTTAEYQRLVADGFFASDDHLTLLDGQVVEMSPTGNYQAAAVEFVVDQLCFLLSSNEYMVWSQHPVVLSNKSESEPDIAVVKARNDYYRERHPGPQDIHLLIEVADTSLEKTATLRQLVRRSWNHRILDCQPERRNN